MWENKAKKAEHTRNRYAGSKMKKIIDSLQTNKFVSPEDMLYYQQISNKQRTCQNNNSIKNRECYDLLKGEDHMTLGLNDRIFIEKYKSIVVGSGRRIRRRTALVNQLKHYGSEMYNVNSGNTTMKMLGQKENPINY